MYLYLNNKILKYLLILSFILFLCNKNFQIRIMSKNLNKDGTKDHRIIKSPL